MTDDLEKTIHTARIINHARGYFAGIDDACRFLSGKNREFAIAKLMKKYEADNPDYVRVKNDN